MTASDSTKFRFATDGEGNYGYLKADDSFVPFKSGFDYRGTEYKNATGVWGINRVNVPITISNSKKGDVLLVNLSSSHESGSATLNLYAYFTNATKLFESGQYSGSHGCVYQKMYFIEVSNDGNVTIDSYSASTGHDTIFMNTFAILL